MELCFALFYSPGLRDVSYFMGVNWDFFLKSRITLRGLPYSENSDESSSEKLILSDSSLDMEMSIILLYFLCELDYLDSSDEGIFDYFFAGGF
jgi:hypothetical protein